MTLALEGDNWDVTAVDISGEALRVARHNAVALGASVRFFQGNWYQALPVGRRFDLIVSNPPYIACHDPHLQMGDVSFEPMIALTDGVDGLSCFSVLADSALTWLERCGWLLVEHGYDQGPAVRECFVKAGLVSVQTLPDLAGHERITLGQAPPF